jgi:hypothetical protein
MKNFEKKFSSLKSGILIYTNTFILTKFRHDAEKPIIYFLFSKLAVEQNALNTSTALGFIKNSALWVSRVTYRFGGQVILGAG